MNKNYDFKAILGVFLFCLLIGTNLSAGFDHPSDFSGENEKITIPSNEYYIERFEDLIGPPLTAGTVLSLNYSTFLGGMDEDTGYGIAVDTAGCAYITGYTWSTEFPTTPVTINETHNGGYSDAFVCKMNAAGTAIIYSTFIGGGSSDWAKAIAVDSSGCAYVVGFTYSDDFPTTPGVIDETYNADRDVFVCKINPTGTALEYSTFIGGTGWDEGHAIAVDSAGCAYIAGFTRSGNFPTTSGAFNQTHDGSNEDVFVCKLNATGTELVYSTYIGGTADDRGYGIDVDIAGCAYVAGYTDSVDFPTMVGSFDESSNGDRDVFVCKLNNTGTALEYSTYLGGSAADQGYGVALDATGCAYVSGYCESSDFPTKVGSYDEIYNGNVDTFVCKLNAAGTGLEYSTYIGAIAWDYGRDIAVDSTGHAYVCGNTGGQFPTTSGALDDSSNIGEILFVSKLNAAGTSLDYSTCLGGSGGETGYAIAVDNSGGAYVTGFTTSGNFPTTSGSFNETYGASEEAFVFKISAAYSASTGETDDADDGKEDENSDDADDSGDESTEDGIPGYPIGSLMCISLISFVGLVYHRIKANPGLKMML